MTLRLCVKTTALTRCSVTLTLPMLTGSGEDAGDDVSRGEDHLAGRFSADGKTLTADQELVFQLTSGNVITYHFAWTATRQ